MAFNASATNTTVKLCLSFISYVRSSPSTGYTINAIAASVVNAILVICGLLVNSLVVIAFWKSPLLRSKTPFFLIMVISINDLLVVLFSHPLFLLSTGKQLAGSGDCATKTIYLTVATLLTGFSGLTLHVINIERYLAIVYPFIHQRHVTRTNLLITTVILWSFWLPIPFVPFFNTSLQGKLIAISATIVCITTIFVYVRIFQIARKKRRLAPEPSRFSVSLQEDSITALDSTVTSAVRQRSKLTEAMKDIKLAKMFILLVVCSQVCYLPDIAYHVYEGSKKDVAKTESSLMIGSWVVTFICMNSTLNSLIFFWKNSQLRKEMLRTAKCC